MILAYPWQGDTYLARLSDVRQDIKTTDTNLHLLADAVTSNAKNVDKYYLEVGHRVVEKLAKWYRAGVPTPIWGFRNILLKRSESFDEWKTNGGHHIHYDAAPGDELTLESKRLAAEFYHRACAYPKVDGGKEQDLCRFHHMLSDELDAWFRLIVAAAQGLSTMAKFIKYVDNFNGLDINDQEALIRGLHLNQEVFHHLTEDEVQSYRVTWGDSVPPSS